MWSYTVYLLFQSLVLRYVVQNRWIILKVHILPAVVRFPPLWQSIFAPLCPAFAGLMRNSAISWWVLKKSIHPVFFLSLSPPQHQLTDQKTGLIVSKCLKRLGCTFALRQEALTAQIPDPGRAGNNTSALHPVCHTRRGRAHKANTSPPASFSRSWLYRNLREEAEPRLWSRSASSLKWPLRRNVLYTPSLH